MHRSTPNIFGPILFSMTTRPSHNIIQKFLFLSVIWFSKKESFTYFFNKSIVVPARRDFLLSALRSYRNLVLFFISVK